MTFLRYCLLFSLLCPLLPLRAQIIFTESLATVIDTTRSWQGSVAPELNFKTEKENFFSFKNNANVSWLLQKKKAITLINQLEITAFAELVWSPTRGLLLRVASGMQSRYRLIQSEHFILTSGIGFFYEYEKWNMDGVPKYTGENITLHQRTLKTRLAIGFKILFSEKWQLTTSSYMHSRLDSNIANPRFAYDLQLKHHITKNFGIWLSYQLIQHTKPIVPIKKMYLVTTGGVFISW